VIRRLRRPPRGLSCRGAFRSLSNSVHRLTRCVASGVLAGSARRCPVARSRPLLSWNFGPVLPLFRVSPGTSTPAPHRFRSVLPRFVRLRSFGRKELLFRLVPPSWFLPPRRFAPFPASSMLQLAPDLGFARLVPRRSLVLRWSFDLRSTSDRAREDPVRLALRRFLLAGSWSTSLWPLPSCRSSPRPPALAVRSSFVPHEPKFVGGAFRSVSVAHRVSSVRSEWAREFLSGMSPVPRPLGCPGTWDGDIGSGSNLLDRLALAGLLESKMWTPSPVPLAGTGRAVGSLRPGFWNWGSPAPSPPSRGTGGRSLRGPPITRGPLDLRSLVQVPCGLAPRDGALGFRWRFGFRGGSFRSLAAPVAPSPSVIRALHVITGRLQGVAPPTSPDECEVYCNARILCSFLGFFSPPRLSPEIAGHLRGPCRIAVSRVPSRLRFPNCPIRGSRIAPRIKGRTLARFPSVRFRGLPPLPVAASLGF
jgi:hypothetical protein